MKALWIVSVSWLVLLCGLFVFATPLVEALWMLYPLLHWGTVAVGAGILVWGALTLRRAPKPSLAALLLVGAGLALFFTSGFRFGRRALFEIRKSRYEAQLAEATRTGQVPSDEGSTDEGPPVLHAFYWFRGVTDNWAGVVHDPGGVVKRLDGMEGVEALNDASLQDVVMLFGGHMYRCEHVGGDWYICWFT